MDNPLKSDSAVWILLDRRLLFHVAIISNPDLFPLLLCKTEVKPTLTIVVRCTGPVLLYGACIQQLHDFISSLQLSSRIAHLPLADPKIQCAVCRVGFAGLTQLLLKSIKR